MAKFVINALVNVQYDVPDELLALFEKAIKEGIAAGGIILGPEEAEIVALYQEKGILEAFIQKHVDFFTDTLSKEYGTGEIKTTFANSELTALSTITVTGGVLNESN